MVQPITSTTQDHLPIYEIQDELIILKDGSAALILQTTAVNFGLLSEKEQDAIIYAYAALLNSLSFPIQIIIRSERKDISSYLELLSEAANKQTSPLKRRWITKYRSFINETVQDRNVLDKQFFIVIPFQSLELGTIKSLSHSHKLPAPLAEIANKAGTVLAPRRDHLVRQLERIGLSARQLNNRELLNLLYRTYNPGATAPKVDPAQFTSPMIEPVIINQPNRTEKPTVSPTSEPIN